MSEQAEIQLWSKISKQTLLGADASANALRVGLVKNTTPVPDALEREVQNMWDAKAVNNPNMSDGRTLFLRDIRETDYGTDVMAHVGNFRFINAFNRTVENHNRTDELKSYNLLHISTHVHAVTIDGYLLFGTKKNQFNQISGFAGFIQESDGVQEIGEQRFQDMNKTIRNRLQPEIKDVLNYIVSVTPTGITYVGTPGLRGTDMDFLAIVNMNAENAKALFQNAYRSEGSGDQFTRMMYAVPFTENGMTDFVERIHGEGKTMSRYALGAMVLEAGMFHGDKAAGKLMDTINKHAKTSIVPENQTDYLQK